MATRVCPNCGSQYVASVRRCIDCDVMLVDDVGVDGEVPAPSSATPLGEGDQIAYELEGWGSQLKVTLEGMLDRAGIVRVWEAGALVVPAAHEDEVDQLVATVEGGDAIDLDPDAEQIAFEIEGLSIDELSDLDARLIAAHIAHAWDEGGDLLVGADDEATVAEMIDEVLNAEPAAADDGMALHDALDTLFVAVDKLVKDPFDAKLSSRFAAAADGLDGLGVPYGLSGSEWDGFLAQVVELRSVLDGTPATDESGEVGEVGEAATSDDGSDEDAPAETADVADVDLDEDDADEDDADADDAHDADAEAGDDPAAGTPSAVETATRLAIALRTRMRDLV